ncbi:MAG: T9SS type A sorting domain-containing protein, partial [Saprospiraceae bacterium]
GLDIIQGFVKTANGEYVINHLETVPSNNNLPDTKLHVVRFDTDGNLLWDNDYLAIPNQNDMSLYSWQYYVTGRGITSLADGGTISTAMAVDASTVITAGTVNMMVYKVDADGNTVWERSIGVPGASDYIYDVMEDSDGNILLCGSRGGQCFVAKMDANGYIYSNVITGSVAEDADQNCMVDSGESPYESWIVEAVGNSSFYALTDENGNYELRVDSGSYLINVVPPNPYFTSCVNDEAIDYPGFYNSDVIDFPITENADCPYMVVDIGATFLRRCFDNTYYVTYCNSGTSESEDTYIEVDFDEYLSVNSASIPFTVVNDTYVFDVGTVAENECGSFTVSVFVDCDSTVLGQTHCTEARIYPDSICVPPNPLWSGASLDLTASCNNGNITFTTKNVGSGDMMTDLNYFVIEDQIVMLTGSDEPLLIQGVSTLDIPATGGTFRLEVEQIPGHPNPEMPSITIEGCSADTSSFFSLGFVTMYPENDGSPAVSIDCQENIGSFDPNDKLAYPKGYEEEHFIEANTDIEYRIRFQNTGTDTAFLVTIIDTLSSFLNPATVRPGASSHPYEFSMDGNGVMKFTFNNIMLADSNTNEPASHGFVKFKISQRADNPIGTMIHNEADIYFDSNEPIRTNDAWHTIGENFITVSANEIPDSYIQITNYPNPFVTQTTFEVNGEEYSDITLRVHDVTGRTLRQEEFDGSTLNFQRGNLNTGLYFYEIVGDGHLIGSGRFVVQ